MTKITDMDFREKAEILINLLKSLYGFELNIAALKHGDYFIFPDTIVERNSTCDFLVFIIDERLFNQVYPLAEHCEHPVIIIEGKTFSDEGILLYRRKQLKGR